MHVTRGFGRSAGVLAIVVGMVLLPMALVAGTAHAVTPAVTSSTQAWAYGGSKTVSISGKGGHGMGYEYTIHAYYGIHVIFNQTNTSSTTTALELQRTMGATVYITYCMPSCGYALYTANYTLKFVEVGAGFANLTSAGTVFESGTPVGAVALVNSAGEVSTDLNESLSFAAHSGMMAKSSSFAIDLHVNGTAEVSFTPALGLYPLTLTNGTTWNSSASYVASGGWGATAAWSLTPMSGNASSGNASASGAVSRDGTVDLTGADVGTTLLNDGSSVQVLAVGLSSPFSFREGILVVPTGVDVLQPESGPAFPGGSSMGGTSNQLEQNETVALLGSNLDVPLSIRSHFGPAASAMTFNSGAAEPATTGVTAALQPAALPPDQTGPTTLQAQPETVDAAHQGSTCLVTGSCPPGSTTSQTALRVVGLGIVLVLAVAVVSATVLVAQRRRTPPPPHPNAHLYPPGAAGIAPSPPPPVPLGRAPVGDDGVADPLDNLW